MTRGVDKDILALPGQSEGGESRDFHLSALLDGDLSQLLAEIARTVAVGE